MKPEICRDTYMVYKDNSLVLVRATVFEIAFLKRYIKENGLRLAAVKINKKNLTSDKIKRSISFESYLKDSKLIFNKGKLEDKRQQSQVGLLNLMMVIVLVVVQVLILVALLALR